MRNSLNVGAKISYLGWWPLMHDSNLTPFLSHVKNQLPRFPQATGPHPSPSRFPFQPCMPTHLTQFVPWKTTLSCKKPSSSDTFKIAECYADFKTAEKVAKIPTTKKLGAKL